ncbi:MAG: hypothetical protein ACI97A_004396 [Planctomycetota bacterium]|jgi:hypothetical protein
MLIRQFSILILLVSLAPMALYAQTPLTSAKMVYPKKGWDFGTVTQGVQKQKKLKLKNIGSKPLVIHFAKVTCGCLKATPQSQSILPNATGILTVNLDSFRQSGKIKKHIVISTNSPSEKQVFIPVFGEIKPLYRLESKNLDFGEIPSNEAQLIKMRIFSLPGLWPEIKSIAFNEPALKIDAKRFGKANEEHGILVTAKLAPMTRAGKLVVPVRINLKSGALDAIRFAVVGDVLGDLRIEPKKLKCPPLSKTKTYTAKIKFRSTSGKPFSLTKATCHDPRVLIGTLQSKQATEHVVEVTADPGGKLGVIRARIYIVTDRDDQRIFTVPVEIRVIP